MAEPARGFRHRTYRPRLPKAEAVLPYLQKIDSNGWYTNFGPLNARFEERLAKRYGLDPARVVTVASCTAGLALTLQSYDQVPDGPRPGDLCALPSWTFVGTAAAVRLAGLVPWFLDVDRESWQLTPQIVEAALAAAPGRVAAVMPVAPFGDRADASSWRAFRARQGLPVVLDAAAGFDSVSADHAPAVVSLHATKPLGIGEGGFVLAESAAQAEAIRRRSNFGFDRHHQAAWPGCNAKLSEYAAAVGLAALDAWAETRAAFAASVLTYREALAARCTHLELSPSFAHCEVNTSCNLSVPGTAASALVAELCARGIEARQWWGQGCHGQPAYAAFPRADLSVTEDLARHSLALPYHPELSQAEVEEIADALQEAVLAVG